MFTSGTHTSQDTVLSGSLKSSLHCSMHVLRVSVVFGSKELDSHPSNLQSGLYRSFLSQFESKKNIFRSVSSWC